MKRFKHACLLWMSLLAVFCLFMAPVQAEEILEAQASSEQYKSGDFTYSYTSTFLYPDLAGTICIDSYDGNEAFLWIFDTLDGKTITTFGPGAFHGDVLNTVWIPNTIQGALINWINGEITSAFSECTALEEIIFEMGMTKVPSQICWNCTSLKTVHIQDGTTEIGENAFRGCTNLTTAYIPGSVETIPYNAFYGCNNLVIYGDEGSYAQDYAEKYGFQFKRDVEPEDIQLDVSSISLPKGSSRTLTATILPEDAPQDTFWSTSDPDIVTVSEEGKVTAKRVGTAVITVETMNCIPATCTVKVTAPEATSVSLNLTSISLEAGKTKTLSAKVNPSDASQSVSWSSSDTKVATVSNGTVKGESTGTATITAKTENGKTATCRVTVTDASSETKPIYRLYMPSTGEHLYTSDKHEYDTLYQKYGWGQEGIGWYAPSSGTAVYRLYQPGLKNHLYTTDKNEVRVLTSKYGWVTDNGGEALYYSGGSVPIYRVYNKGLNGMHHLTTDTNEYNTLPKFGWQQEGATLYATKLGSPYATTKFYK